jgi:hypothetical protein
MIKNVKTTTIIEASSGLPERARIDEPSSTAPVAGAAEDVKASAGDAGFCRVEGMNRLAANSITRRSVLAAKTIDVYR